MKGIAYGLLISLPLWALVGTWLYRMGHFR